MQVNGFFIFFITNCQQLALDYTYSVDEVLKSILTRLRRESSPVVDYLFSRSVAGTTHQDLINGVTKLYNGAIKAKFFHMFPKRAVQLSRWLAQWISKGEFMHGKNGIVGYILIPRLFWSF